jgi:aspartyl-tRNA(Asn)/glutamyl-tRNA(Gln) amidotransferase subunit A
MSAALCDLPAYEQARRVRQGDLSPVELLEAHLERIAQVEGRAPASGPLEETDEDRRRVHAFISLSQERARRQALALQERLGAGEDPGPLAGLTLAVKDIFCVAGTRSTAGSRILEPFISPYTATAVARLEAAGAVILGKTNMDEFAFGSSTEASAFRPTTRNPWDLERVPGGSSGGSAAALAAGEAAIAMGTDTAGSIRQPAAFCGVVGLKPTYGRVSRYGLIAFASSLDCPGPMARTVRDVALMLGAMAGPDPYDATAAYVEVPDYQQFLERDLRGVRIGLSPDTFRLKYPDPKTGQLQEISIQPEIEAAVLEAAELLARQGAEIVEGVPLPHSHYGIPAYFVISRVEAASNLHRYDGVKYGYRHPGPVEDLRQLYRLSRGQGFGTQVKLRILMGMYVSAEQYEKGYYQRALKVRTLIRADYLRAFDPQGPYRLDCLLTATTPTTAFRMGEVYGDSLLMQYADLLTVPADHAGIPALSIPGGLDSQGLPIGLQLLGPDFSEGILLQVAAAYERATADAPWRASRPMALAGEVGP